VKKFNLEEALNGAKVITREGHQATQITLFEGDDVDPETATMIAVVNGFLLTFYKNGSYFKSKNMLHKYDLFMSPKKLLGFVNVYADGVVLMFDTKKSANECDAGRIACIDLSEFKEGEGLSPSLNFQEYRAKP